MPRMRILSSSEQETFDAPPRLDHVERKRFLILPKALMAAAARLRTPTSKIGFLLLCGHFKATKRFFLLHDFHERGVVFVANQLDLEGGMFDPDKYTETTRLRHQRRILEFYGFRDFDATAGAAMAAEIATMARAHLKPPLIFDRCVDFLVQRRVQVPKSGVLLEQIRSGLHARKAELVALMDAQLTDDARALLDDLFTTAENQNRYRLTLLKKLSQSTRPTRIKEAIADFETLAALHDRLHGVLAALELGTAGIRYHAGSVLRSEMFQIQRREDNDRHIHAAAFVVHQFHRSQDNLIDLWLSVMASFQATATREHNEFVLESRKRQQEHLKAVVDDLDTSVFGLIRDIHSTDSHGYNEAVFGLTHLLGFSFAPRIKGVGKQTLYIFRPRSRDGDADWMIRPDKTANETIIRQNWDDLLRLVATIKLKENTASDIFRRLNSYSRQHALYQTLKAFGQIVKSLFILRYADDLALRQSIERQLNKAELANRFTRAVAVGNPREFTQAEKEEQEIAETCNRLIRNSIICWNYFHLSRQPQWHFIRPA